MTGKSSAPQGSDAAGLSQHKMLRSILAVLGVVGAIAWLAWVARDTWVNGTIRESVRDLRSSDVIERRAAADALAHVSRDELPLAVKALVSASVDKDVVVRESCVRALGSGSFSAPGAWETRAAVDALSRALGDSVAKVRVEAARSLGLIALRVPIELPSTLTTALRSDLSEDVRSAAAEALGRSSRALDSSALALLDAVGSDSAAVRTASDSAIAHGKVELSAATSQAVIHQLHTARDARVRCRAASLLGAGVSPPGNEAVVQALLDTLDAPLGSPPPPLRVAKRVTPPPGLRIQPFSGAGSGIVLPAELSREDDTPGSWDPACEAARALGRIALRSDRIGEVVEALTKALHSAHPWRREAAAEGLFLIGKASTPAVPELARALSLSVEAERSGGRSNSWAARAISEAAPGSPVASQAIGPLVLALESKGAGTRAYSAEALGRLGSDACVATPQLRALVDDPDRLVSQKVREALSRLEKPHPQPEGPAR